MQLNILEKNPVSDRWCIILILKNHGTVAVGCVAIYNPQKRRQLHSDPPDKIVHRTYISQPKKPVFLLFLRILLSILAQKQVSDRHPCVSPIPAFSQTKIQCFRKYFPKLCSTNGTNMNAITLFTIDTLRGYVK
jgi:hypothetical protein